MTRAAKLVVALRLIVPISILRWPLGAGLAAAALDAADVVLVDAFARALNEPAGFGSRYARIDKWLHRREAHPWQWLKGMLGRLTLRRR